MQILKTTPDRSDVRHLIRQSDAYFAGLYPAASNHLESVEELSSPNVLMVAAIDRNRAVAIGAVKSLTDDGQYGEIKRLFVAPAFRGNGVSKLIMQYLEQHLAKNDIPCARLETGISERIALSLYRGLGYHERGPFGRYSSDPLSLFMEKNLTG